MATGRIKDWPAAERPRERLRRQGSEALSDAELLAIVLVSGCARKGTSAVDCARELLLCHGSLRDLFAASAAQLSLVPGVGPGKAARVVAVGELARRLGTRTWDRGTAYASSRDVVSSYAMRLRDVKQEQFMIAMLDSKNRLLREKKVSLGTVNHSVVHPREVFGPAVRESAVSIVLVHNHPSGDPRPSTEDDRLTDRLVSAGELLGIRVLDHVIIGDGRHYSYCDDNRLGAG